MSAGLQYSVNIPVGVVVVEMFLRNCGGVQMFMYSPVADPGEGGTSGPPVREQSLLLPILNLSIHLLYSIEEIQLNVSNISPKYRFEPNISIKVQASEM